MIITKNDNGESHAKIINRSICSADEILLVSPYLFYDFAEWIKVIDFSGLKSVHLVTSLKPSGDDHLRKPFALLSFIDGIRTKAPHVKVVVSVNNSLHGKVYIFKNNGKYINAVITSANLTHPGMNDNHEWGLQIFEQIIIEDLEKQVASTIEYYDVPRDVIAGKLCLAAENYKEKVTKNIDLGLVNLLKHHAPSHKEVKEIDLEKARRIFLKPIGHSERPVLAADKEKFSEHTSLHFPNPKPRLFGPGDIVISFGTGSRNILMISTSLTTIEEIPKRFQLPGSDEERWPWRFNSYNHTKLYSDHWWEYDLTIDSLLSEYQAIHPQYERSLGTFNFGSGRLEIDKEWASYIIEKVLQVNDGLAANE